MKIYIMALEPIETRYTAQWLTSIPDEISSYAKKNGIDFPEIVIVMGDKVSGETTPGAFLNFTDTNIWKNTQLNHLCQMYKSGDVKDGDKILFTDAWNSGIIQAKYMSELLDVKAEIHSIWHAGSYDPFDFLGRKVKDKRWSLAFEKSAFHASDFNYFATQFHVDLFCKSVLADDFTDYSNKIVLSGQPHSVLVRALVPFNGKYQKKNKILFPHRVAPEKQPEIFRDLEASMPDVEFMICQEHKLTKDEYHQHMAESKIMFSANLQETLGISAMEAILVNTMPFLPDRLSYSEMYDPLFLYPSAWTDSFDSYLKHKNEIIQTLYDFMYHYDDLYHAMEKQKDVLMEKYLNANAMVGKLLK